jgi:ferredoxin-NADP reductase
MSMARAAYDLAANLDIVFVHSARSPADIIFRDELAQMQAHQSRFRVLAICEAKGEETDWQSPIGRLDLALLSAQVPDWREREVFTCGPQGYMTAARGVLENAGFDLAHYHQESFDINALAAETSAPATPASETGFTVTLAKSGKTFSVSPTQTLLAAAKKAGAVVPSSCSQGVCGTCKTAVLQGEVDMQHNGGIRQREIDKGLRLLCCSRPTSDLVLDL